ncbi:DUF3301 domain-containing protein [Shewanella surugensis]|uniref:DUF3301 domain-containing protein n=1 Tax=Shewanella surugensis TaxID=212020 RepID=A0ABT0LG45_9GAMM|nr:DUF3301 domain-containing protein [Shewanella surugensis]MCL1126677.1 DUF3301 domain-containing protein [Shewanella surugensis]
MIMDIFIILALVVIIVFFWQLRQMAEVSRVYVNQECQRQQVQLLAIAQHSARPSLGGHSGFTWKASYLFEFSTNGIDKYQGNIWMLGTKIQKIEWPVFPEPQWQDAPNPKGNIGSCSNR